MKSFFSIRLKRRTAFAMLALWIVTVASGVANACLLDIHGVHEHHAIAQHAATTHEPLVAKVTHESDVEDHDDDQALSKESCLKVCDDSSRFLPKPKFGFDLLDVQMAPPVASVWISTVSFVAAVRASYDRNPTAPERPARIRFLRLAL
ncbi:MAG: hypothetical protein ABIZ64_15830 [Casimicrobium sp.]|jgi:hypothetical protein